MKSLGSDAPCPPEIFARLKEKSLRAIYNFKVVMMIVMMVVVVAIDDADDCDDADA